VINELTSLPRHYTPAEMKAAAERDRKVRVEGNINLLAAIRDAGVRRYPLHSSGFWYAPGAGLADESVPFISVRPRESRLAPAPSWNWKGAHRRRRESSSSRSIDEVAGRDEERASPEIDNDAAREIDARRPLRVRPFPEYHRHHMPADTSDQTPDPGVRLRHCRRPGG
jgi:hypothetical protein